MHRMNKLAPSPPVMLKTTGSPLVSSHRRKLVEHGVLEWLSKASYNYLRLADLVAASLNNNLPKLVNFGFGSLCVPYESNQWGVEKLRMMERLETVRNNTDTFNVRDE